MGQTTSSDEKPNDDAHLYVKLEDLPFKLPHGMRVSIKFLSGVIKPGTVVIDHEFLGVGGVENMKVKFDDGSIQTFTSRDGETIRVKFEYSHGHYRGGIRRKTHKKRKIRRNKKSKSRRR